MAGQRRRVESVAQGPPRGPKALAAACPIRLLPVVFRSSALRFAEPARGEPCCCRTSFSPVRARATGRGWMVGRVWTPSSLELRASKWGAPSVLFHGESRAAWPGSCQGPRPGPRDRGGGGAALQNLCPAGGGCWARWRAVILPGSACWQAN